MDITPESTSNKNEKSQVGLHKTKKLLHSKSKQKQTNKKTTQKTIYRVTRQPTEYKIFANHISGRRFISKIYKELLQHHSKKTQITYFLNGQRT